LDKKTSVNKNKLLTKFLRVFMMVFAIMILMIGIFTTGYLLLNKAPKTEAGNDLTDGSDQSGLITEDGISGAANEEGITTIAIYGVDRDGYRTDVTMLAFFNRESMAIDIISIPRDTWIKLPEDIYATLKDRREDTKEYLKINEIPAFAEPSLRYETSVAVIEETFGIDIDYYIALDLDGFVKIVDLVGPIIMDIPNDMKYTDPVQDLYIDISAGDDQEIWGTQAEGIIRYRSGYANGDIGRIDMQHQFMVAFLDKLLNLENRLNIVNIATTALIYIDTDFYDAIDYVNYIDDIDPSLITIQTLPGEVSSSNTAHYLYDYDETKLLLNQIINYDADIEVVGDTTGIDEVDVIEPEILIDAKTLNIVVLNGTRVSGLAGRTTSALTEAGYLMGPAADFSDKPVEKTILQVPSQYVGKELATYFNDPIIEVDAELLDADVQVTIILGGTDGESY
jgi:LCP family protein required for cell wall assembly